MERYAPNAKDLACRDVVSRASQQRNYGKGRGDTFSGTSCVWLDLTHLGEDVINERLPTVRELGRTFAGIDPVEKPIPVVPTCHYQMGGDTN